MVLEHLRPAGQGLHSAPVGRTFILVLAVCGRSIYLRRLFASDIFTTSSSNAFRFKGSPHRLADYSHQICSTCWSCSAQPVGNATLFAGFSRHKPFGILRVRQLFASISTCYGFSSHVLRSGWLFALPEFFILLIWWYSS